MKRCNKGNKRNPHRSQHTRRNTALIRVKHAQKNAINELMALDLNHSFAAYSYVKATSFRRLRALCIKTTRPSSNKAGI